jgi:hypothetical protein
MTGQDRPQPRVSDPDEAAGPDRTAAAIKARDAR